MFCEGACRKALSAAFYVFNVARNIFISDKIKKKKDYAYQEFLREKKESTFCIRLRRGNSIWRTTRDC